MNQYLHLRFGIIHGESLDEAEELARSRPYIAGVRVYDLRAT